MESHRQQIQTKNGGFCEPTEINTMLTSIWQTVLVLSMSSRANASLPSSRNKHKVVDHV